MARRAPRRTRPSARPPRVRPAGARAAPRERAPTIALEEDPHSHIVCRSCGRIQRLELTELDRLFLTDLAGRRPDGWTVDRISFSLTGACRRCREGPGT